MLKALVKYAFSFSLFICLSFTVNSQNWLKKGYFLHDSVAVGEGHVVSLSKDGNTLATNIKRKSTASRVGVFDWNGKIWIQKGSDLSGSGGFGWSLDMGDNGSAIAVGSPSWSTNDGRVNVYEWNGTSWANKGTGIGGSNGEKSGWSVALSEDAKTLAIGSTLYDGFGPLKQDIGRVRIYDWQNSSWVLNTSFQGDKYQDYFGESVSISPDGKTIAVGARLGDEGSSNAGYVKVFELVNSSWRQKGKTIGGEASGDQSGHSVSISGDGEIVAIGAPLNDGNGSNSGHTRVYSWSGTAWVQMGLDIDGEAVDDRCGWALDLDESGEKLAVGAIWNNSNDGHVRIYSWNDTAWVQDGSDLDGKKQFGRGISFNENGNVIAIGNNSLIHLNDVEVYSNCSYIEAYDTLTTCRTEYLWKDSLYFKGIYTVYDTFPTSSGCDSIHSESLIVNGSTFNETVIACDSYTWLQNGKMYLQSNIYEDTLLNAFGCDSIVTLDLTINNSTSTILNQTSCESFTWLQNNTIYTNSGTYYDTVLNSMRCDSAVTLNLTILKSSDSTLNVNECDRYFWPQSGLVYSNSGLYQHTIPNRVGCDSIVTLNLTIFQSPFSTLHDTACKSYTWLQNGKTYLNSGTYYDTVINTSFCDSIYILHLIIPQSIYSRDTFISNCTPPFTWGNNNKSYSKSGTYYDTLTSSIGCDSISLLYLSICDTCTNSIGCDSCLSPSIIDFLNLSVDKGQLLIREIGGAAQWEIEYDTAGFALGAGFKRIIFDSVSDTVYDLVDNVEYDFYIRSLCLSGLSSDWSGPYTFTYYNGLCGDYTINSINVTDDRNYQSFTDFINDLDIYGVSCPVNVDVISGSGPYDERVVFNTIEGSSLVNTITVNGSGETVSFSPTALDRRVLGFDGAKHITINDLRIEGTNKDYGYGIHFMNNSDSNTVNNCIVDLSKISNKSYEASAGIIISGSKNSNTSVGSTASYLKIENNQIIGDSSGGAFSGISIVGSHISHSKGIQVINNVIFDFYSDGIFIDNQENLIISGNKISRPYRSDVAEGYGIFIDIGDSKDILIEKNFIHNMFGGNANSNKAFYGLFNSFNDATSDKPIRFQNNIIQSTNSNGDIYGIYNNNSDNALYYHNTFYVNDTSSTMGNVRGFYNTNATSGVSFENNIISIKRSGIGSKHGIYLNAGSPTLHCDYNIIKIDTLGDGGEFVGYFGGNQLVLNDWQMVNSNSYGQNSLDIDPDFRSVEDLTPTNILINNKGVSLDISEDYYNNFRDSIPDIGAVEFDTSHFYLFSTINVINNSDSNGVADSALNRYQLTGTVVGVDLDPSENLSFYMINQSNGSQEGIHVYNAKRTRTIVSEGDSVRVKGKLVQNNGLLSIMADSVKIASKGNSLPSPLQQNVLNESSESKLIEFLGLSVIRRTNNGDYVLEMKNDSIFVNIHEETDIIDSLNIKPLVAGDSLISIVGIGSQYDTTYPYTSGYQIIPMQYSDIRKYTCIPTFFEDSVTVCEYYIWDLNGKKYDSSGTYIDTTLNVGGCDSIVSLELDISQDYSSNSIITSCDSFIWSQTGLKYTSSGVYSDTITNINGCDSTFSIDLTIVKIDTAVIKDQHKLIAKASGVEISYQWLDCTNGDTAISGATSQTYEVIKNGDYAVEITLDECIDTSSCISVIQIGLSEYGFNEQYFTIYPNPTKNRVVIRSQLSKYTIRLLSINGKLIKYMEGSFDTELTLENLSSGLYFVELQSQEALTRKKLVLTY